MAKFDESKHPRDKEGKFTFKGGYRQNTKYSEIIENDRRREDKKNAEDSQRVKESGAQSGALDSGGKDFKRAEIHAKKRYETFRNIKGDISEIAKLTGHSIEEIERVKQHMFFNEYDLADGHHRFYPDFDQAQSWGRLWGGNPEPCDFVMIEHELIEERLMNQKGMSYDEAHAEANKTADYSKAVKEYNNAVAKKKGN